MRNYRQTLAGIAAMAMLLNTAPAMIPQAYSMLSVAVSAAEEESLYTYESNGTSITITGVQTDAVNIIIPETIDGLPVTAIVEDAFAACDQLETLTLPASITAFCIDNICVLSTKGTLRDVIWEGTLPQWQDATYNVDNGVPALSARLHIPADGIVLGVYDTYYRYTSYTEQNYVVIDGVANTEYELPITEIVIPDEIEGIPVRDIAPYAFQWQSGITSVSLPSSIRSIGARAFMNCARLETITFPTNLMSSIGESAFSGCTSLKDLVLPTLISSIGANAFSGCTSLTEMEFPVGTRRDMGIFANCTSLASIHFPSGLDEIPQNMFSGCTALADVYFDGTETDWHMIPIGTGNEALDTAAIHFAETTEGVYGDFTYENVNDKYVVITGLAEDALKAESIDIPLSIGGVYVKEIGESAFAGSPNLKVVTLPSTITKIGDYAFQNCKSMQYCNLPEGVYHIGKYAFQDCLLLKSVSTPSRLDTISEGCFSGCFSLQTLLVNSPVTTIEELAFSNCENLYSIHLPRSLTSIGKDAFYDCTNVSDIYYEGTETEWNDVIPRIGTGNTAFELKNMTMHFAGYEEKTDTGLIYYKYWDHIEIMDADPAIVTMEIPAAIEGLPVSIIAPSAFEDCTSLQSVTIPDSVRKIGASAFCGCTALRSVTVPDTVTSMGGNVFGGCDSLTDAVIEAPLTSLPYGIFSGCDNLVNVTLPDTLTDISHLAFYNCESLTAIDLPAGITDIRERAFQGCTALRSINLPNALDWIGDHVFYGCKSLTEINLPATVTYIGRGAFGNSGITAVNIDPANTTYKSVDGVVFNLSGSYLRCYPGGREGAYTIPDGVLVVDEYAFDGAEKLTSITISESVVTLMDFSFQNCTALTEVNIPATLEAIYGNVFQGCTSLTTFNVEDGSEYFKEENGMLIRLKKSELLFCPTNVTGTVTIPDGIAWIGARAFAGCEGITDVVFPETLTTIRVGAFQDCTGLTELVIPDHVTGIHDYAFEGCENLTSLVLPEGLKTIDGICFQNCPSLKEVTIPASVTTVSSYAFYGCKALETIYYGGTEAQWNEITILEGNEALLTAKVIPAVGHALGDLDGDGLINTNDAALLLMDAAIEGASGKSDLTDAQKTAADVNGDGIRNATDAALILHYAAYLGTGGTDSLETYVANFGK